MKRKFRHRYVAVVTVIVRGESSERYRSYEQRIDAEDHCYRINKYGPLNETARVVDAETELVS